MYRVTCDGYPLLDYRDNDLILVDPKLRLEVNTVCEGSFTIYKNHPYYDKLQLLKSVVEVSDEYGVIFRGRPTCDTVDINNGMTVDMEGVLAYFNDSVVRPFKFPDSFEGDAEYEAAAESGNVVEFFLGWLIDNHNSQVSSFQRLYLGNVTVGAYNNHFERTEKEYASTWEILKTNLFDSELGGYLCVRHEEDGNYVDYLSSYEGTNEQEIVFGENLLDIIKETDATETYTAIIPLGSVVEYKIETGVTEGEFVDFVNTKKIEENVNIKDLPDGDLTDDLVKSGDAIYSRSGIVKYGWICAPTNETTWNYIEDAETLQTEAVEWFTSRNELTRSIEVAAVDLHFTDNQIQSLRMYKNVMVHSEPHDLSANFQISMLEIDLLNPQKTVITLGKTNATLADRNVTQQEEAKKIYSKLEQTDEAIRSEVFDELSGLTASIDVALGEIVLEVRGLEEDYTRLAVTLDGVTVTDPDGTTLIKGSSIETGSLKLTGIITWEDLDDDVKDTIDSAGGISEDYAKTLITSELVASPTIIGGVFYDTHSVGRMMLAYSENAPILNYDGYVDGEYRSAFSIGTVPDGGYIGISVGNGSAWESNVYSGDGEYCDIVALGTHTFAHKAVFTGTVDLSQATVIYPE